MPDVSKLRELCAILDISIDYLLGGEVSATAEKAIDHIEMTAAEICAVAPILPPDKVEDMAESAAGSGSGLSAKHLCSLAPFLDSRTLANRIELTDGETLAGLAPFLSKHALNDLVCKVETISTNTLINIAPFMSKQALDKLVDKVQVIDSDTLVGLAPFMGRQTLDRLVDKVKKIGPDILVSLAPFLGRDVLIKLLDRLAGSDE